MSHFTEKMPKQKKTRAETSAEQFFPVEPEDIRYAVEKPYKQPDISSLIKVEKEGKAVVKKTLKTRSPKKKTAKDKGKKTRKKKTKAEYEPQKVSLKKDGYELIITEKPQAALKIASSLGKAVQRNLGSVPYYEIDRQGKKIVVACAVGHLFTLAQVSPRSGIPVFDIKWVPNYLVREGDFSKKYYDVLLRLMKNAGSLTVATDYDIEGELIGLNVVRFIGNQPDAERMKFSTLTEKELNDSYESKSKNLDWGQAIAGETRHYLDWFYGINLSRALMNALRAVGKFKIMSIGRVQGPALNLIAKKEKQISLFKPQPYWQVFITLEDLKIELIHNKDIFKKSELEKFHGLRGKIAEALTSKKQQEIPPNPPFNLTTLQTEAYRLFGINPGKTLQIAQNLYLSGIISYPRTSSQKLPPSINYREILRKLAIKYNAEKLLTRSKPVEGKKADPAHPSIYPTGQGGAEQKALREDERKIYDLIVKRFLSLFCENAVLENKVITAEIDNLTFYTKGSTIINKGWLNIYPLKFQENEIPDINGKIKIIDSRIEEKETQPPRRFSPASIIAELEKRNLGTKCLEFEEPIIIKIGDIIKKTTISDFVENNSFYKNAQILCYSNFNIEWKSPSNINKRRLKNKELLEIGTTNFKMKATKDHPIAVWDGKNITWKPLRNIKKGDKIIRIFYKNYDKKSRLISNIVGDGSINIRKDVKDRTADIRYHNKSIELIERFANVAEELYSKPYISKTKNDKYYVRLSLTNGRKIIKDFPEIIKGYFPKNLDPCTTIGGFFDDEGCVYLEKIKQWKNVRSNGIPKLKIAQKIKKPLYQIYRWLKKIKINSSIRKTYVNYRGSKVKYYEMWIRGRRNIERFAFYIPFFHKEKTKKLIIGLKRYPVVNKKTIIYSMISKNPMFSQDISKAINESGVNTRNILRELEEDGFIKITRIPNTKIKHANNSLFVEEKILFGDTFYSVLNSEMVTSQIFTETVKEIKDAISKKDYVYDITVDLDTPNFIASKGNFLVHNSTRASIIETLYDRGYIHGQSIRATPLGISLIETLEKHSPVIIDEALTRKFEKEMDAIQRVKKGQIEKEEKVIEEAKSTIRKISEQFKKEESEIGEELADANKKLWQQQREENKLNICPACKKGNLQIIYSKKTRRNFIGCGKYPECKNVYSLPPNSLIKKADKVCEQCGFPMLVSIRKGKRPWTFCFNPQCPTNRERIEKYRKRKKENSGNF